MGDASHHRLLARQVRRYLPEELLEAPGMEAFLAAVNEAYSSADSDRDILVRSLDESSKELCVANAELRATFQTLPDSVLTLDSEGRVLDIKGRGFAESDSRQLLGALITEHLRFEDEELLHEALVAVRTSNEPFGQPLSAIGTEADREYELRLVPLSAQRNLVIARDVTQQKRDERALVEARDAAEGAARAKSDFLATMSHEIRTPLNGVIGMTGVLLDTELNEEQREFGRIIHRSGESLLSLINDILDFSKIESHSLELEVVPLSVVDAVEETLEMFADTAGKKGVELGALIDEGVPATVIGDPGRLRQILVNLVGNAVKFTDSGSVLVRANAKAREDGATQLNIAVVDTGIGIPSNALGALFEPFTQADSSTTRRFGGTGLGLAISRRLVRMMGGDIEVASAVGEGTTFHFRAVVGQSEELAEHVPPQPELSHLSILCVDDSDVNLQVLQHQLAGCADDLDLCSNGVEALRHGAARPVGSNYDLAILDMDMPGLDGAELARRMRSTPWGRGLPILLLSSVDEAKRLASARDAGVDAILRKPVRGRQLVERIERLLALDQVAPARPAPRSGSQDSTPSLSVLVAEDNPVNQRVAKTMLRRLNCDVEIAVNGIEAVAAFARGRYDLVLMDCQMPEMDGFDATRAMRALESSDQRTRIIALTANAMSGDRDRCIEAGMDDYVSKPIRFEDLRELLQAAPRA